MRLIGILLVVALANGLTYGEKYGKHIIQDELMPAVLERQLANNIRALPPPEVQSTTTTGCLTKGTTKGGGTGATLTVRPPGIRGVAATITVKPPAKPPITTKPPIPPTTTKPDNPGESQTVLCPTPTSGLTCGLKAFGKEEYNIYAGTARDNESCHQRCLEIKDCQSFQVQVVKPEFNAACNLYRAPSGGDNTIPSNNSPLIFYDRNCPDFSPPECTRRRKRDEERVLRRAQAALAVSTPSYFSTIASASLSTVCSCLVTKPLPTVSITITTSKTALTTEFITKTLTQTSIVTVTSGFVHQSIPIGSIRSYSLKPRCCFPRQYLFTSMNCYVDFKLATSTT
ncbi:hypothetical protein BJ875DRAFT_446432 [Amylocarpus encephaloides]|uniref:Apple domain-containing protein n=1 Tax=Amylocarpus encephaloides TaxID=45428 RepID=A0A9P8C0K3_9HELO|nr:hypothetical protein BJ875DRAFT_446432 [Amylocarpus encephaloides]